MWYSYLFRLAEPIWNKKNSKNFKRSSLKRCDYNMNVMNIQFEYVHCINLRAGFKIIQGMHWLMPWNNAYVRKTVSFWNNLGETSWHKVCQSSPELKTAIAGNTRERLLLHFSVYVLSYVLCKESIDWCWTNSLFPFWHLKKKKQK